MKKLYMNYLLKLLVIIISSIIYSCTSVKTETKKSDINDVIYSPRQKQEREMAEKGGGSFVRDLFVGKSGSNSSSGGVELSVNPHLWQASLDILSSTMPLASVDSNSGIIISDWYNIKNSKNERVKISVLIKSRELRADGLKVSVFKQRFSSNAWNNIQTNPKIVQNLERKIITRAGSLANNTN